MEGYQIRSQLRTVKLTWENQTAFFGEDGQKQFWRTPSGLIHSALLLGFSRNPNRIALSRAESLAKLLFLVADATIPEDLWHTCSSLEIPFPTGLHCNNINLLRSDRDFQFSPSYVVDGKGGVGAVRAIGAPSQ